MLTHKKYTGFPQKDEAVDTGIILSYAMLFIACSVLLSYLWNLKCKRGPLKTLMRKISGG
jgi:hypothetical protein